MRALIGIQRSKRPNHTFVKRQRPWALCALLVTIWLAPSARAQNIIGHVLEVNGRWYLEGNPNQELIGWQDLPAEGVIRIKSPSPENYITLAYPDNRIFLTRRCSSPSECNRPIYLRQYARPRAEPSFWDTTVETVKSLIWGDPHRYSFHRVRGGELPDGVVQLKEGRVDLSPVFKKMDKDRYYVRFRTIPRKGEAQPRRSLGPATFNWDPARPPAVAVNDLRPGLYELGLLERNDQEYEPTGISAWVLVSAPGEYEKAASSYQRAVAVTEGWGKEVKPETVRTFLRAHLDHLAMQMAP